ncbi:MAG: hypothetical protein FD153_204 [Rhodospirillaceae bacterium]|nr:MAG: hypothetical protein FD153_204 [Rhodospirillaceae bacterium]
MHTGLPLGAGDDRDVFVYHKTAVGHAVGKDVTTDLTWHGDWAAWFANNMMSRGTVLIDSAGVVKTRVDDDASIA